MTDSAICSWLIELKKQLKNKRQRSLVVLRGDITWSKSICEQVFSQSDGEGQELKSTKGLVWGDVFGETYLQKVGNFRHELGTENEFIVFVDSAFHPDAFAALSGTLVAGGLFIWLYPEQPNADSHGLFGRRLWNTINNDSNSHVIRQTDKALPIIKDDVLNVQSNQVHEIEGDCLTLGQQQAVLAIDKVICGHRKRPLILTADRGRGKSSAVAIAIADRLKNLEDNRPQRIIVTAPHVDSVKILFTQLVRSCPEGATTNCSYRYKEHIVEFVAIDVLLRDKPEINLLVVDEAAGIPVYLLLELVTHYHRIVFSSTQHGYEGAGRGFATKFLQELTKRVEQVQKFTISEPIRWANDDPLEALVFESFLLDAEYNEQVCCEGFTVKDIEINEITQLELFNDEELLRQVFSVLVTAHYQTSPSDLKLLLDNPSVRVFVGFYQKQVVAVSLGLLEGNASQESITNVLASKVRMASQFIPQSLMVHGNFSNAFNYRYLRIMRIAVVSQLQNYGLGSELLNVIEQYAREHQIDIVGTSFGVSNQLVHFWLQGTYSVARIGFTTDKSSGEHSAMLLKPVSRKGEGFVLDIQQQFYRQFLYLLTQQYRNIAPEIIVKIIMHWPSVSVPVLTDFDVNVVENFIEKKSLFDSCAHSLHLWLVNYISSTQLKHIDCSNTLLLVSRLFQKKSIDELCFSYGLTGKKQLNRLTINAVTMLKDKNPN